MRLLTNNPAKVAGLRAHGIEVTQVRGLEVGRTPHNEAYLRTKATSMGHLLHLDGPGSPDLAPAVHVEPVLAGPAPAGTDTTDHPIDPLEELA